MPDIRFIVIHGPGPRWNSEVPRFEQEGLRQHVEHYRGLLATGKLALGGPFLDAEPGGLMIPAAGVDPTEIEAFANADPAVLSGLLTVQVREWMVGMAAPAA